MIPIFILIEKEDKLSYMSEEPINDNRKCLDFRTTFLGINISSKLIWCSMELLGLRVFLKFYSMMQQELLSQVHSVLTKICVPNREKGGGGI